MLCEGYCRVRLQGQVSAAEELEHALRGLAVMSMQLPSVSGMQRKPAVPHLDVSRLTTTKLSTLVELGIRFASSYTHAWKISRDSDTNGSGRRAVAREQARPGWVYALPFSSCVAKQLPSPHFRVSAPVLPPPPLRISPCSCPHLPTLHSSPLPACLSAHLRYLCIPHAAVARQLIHQLLLLLRELRHRCLLRREVRLRDRQVGVGGHVAAHL